MKYGASLATQLFAATVRTRALARSQHRCVTFLAVHFDGRGARAPTAVSRRPSDRRQRAGMATIE
eukprot:2324989-Lingulodinium_polyedra.AAC.1